MLTVSIAKDQEAWNSFLSTQRFRPFLQSWEMGEVYREIGQEPVRLEVREGNEIVGICFGHIVSARRGRHLSIPYGPIISCELSATSYGQAWSVLLQKLKEMALEQRCTFIRLSPFLPVAQSSKLTSQSSLVPSPLHLLAEHLWYLPLTELDPWEWPHPPRSGPEGPSGPRTADPLSRSTGEGEFPSPPQGGGVRGGGSTAAEIFKNMRATHRNLIRRAEKEGVTITVSNDPVRDLPLFLKLHEETRKRHSFTPYTNTFFQAQVKHFSSPTTYNLPPTTSPRCSLYLANYKSEIIAASIHMHFAGETSYHHGASTQKYRSLPASYLLQWHAIQDAIARGDHVYNFWGIAPSQSCENPLVHTNKTTEDGQEIFLQEKQPQDSPEIPFSPCKKISCPSKHPFAGVTLFKTGFGGSLLELQHCMDLPLKPTYYLTRGFEMIRKWRRGF